MALCVKKQKYRHSPKHVKNIANTSISKCCTYEYFSSPPDDSTNMQIYINRLNLVSKPLIERRHSYWQYKNVRNFDHRLLPPVNIPSAAWIKCNLRAQVLNMNHD